jgi:hypothetical protein
MNNKMSWARSKGSNQITGLVMLSMQGCKFLLLLQHGFSLLVCNFQEEKFYATA